MNTFAGPAVGGAYLRGVVCETGSDVGVRVLNMSKLGDHVRVRCGI